MDALSERIKLTMDKLVELKEKKVWNSIYIKCFICGEFKPASDGVLLESRLTMDKVNDDVVVKQFCEVVCGECEKELPKVPVDEED